MIQPSNERRPCERNSPHVASLPRNIHFLRLYVDRMRKKKGIKMSHKYQETVVGNTEDGCWLARVLPRRTQHITAEPGVFDGSYATAGEAAWRHEVIWVIFVGLFPVTVWMLPRRRPQRQGRSESQRLVYDELMRLMSHYIMMCSMSHDRVDRGSVCHRGLVGLHPPLLSTTNPRPTLYY